MGTGDSSAIATLPCQQIKWKYKKNILEYFLTGPQQNLGHLTHIYTQL
jgi:hypothetical protein